MSKTELRLAILGFGNAGRAFARLLLEKQGEVEAKYGIAIRVVAIATKSRGSLVNPSGVDLEKACRDIEELGRFDEEQTGYCQRTAMDIVEEVAYDVLFELTPLDIFSGQPAIAHIEKAFLRGAHAISANKGPIAWDYARLRSLAAEQGCLFFFETAVMDGTPIFNLAEDALKFCKVTEVKGILNSTTNYVLEELAKGEDYDKVIEEGKRRGFIEADPAMDIEGYDAAAKTTALLNVLMDAGITPLDIDRKGIEEIRVEDIKKAEEKGMTIKLMCNGKIEDGKVKGAVRPEEIPKTELLATIDGTSSALSITTDLMGTVSIIEHAPEIEQTAYGIFSDLVRVLEHRPEPPHK
ncbi:MAG: hypothetical protein ACOYJU_03565 [Anaerovoracaceae bacterium]|jgi:homoserine dehydrogenase